MFTQSEISNTKEYVRLCVNADSVSDIIIDGLIKKMVTVGVLPKSSHLLAQDVRDANGRNHDRRGRFAKENGSKLTKSITPDDFKLLLPKSRNDLSRIQSHLTRHPLSGTVGSIINALKNPFVPSPNAPSDSPQEIDRLASHLNQFCERKSPIKKRLNFLKRPIEKTITSCLKVRLTHPDITIPCLDAGMPYELAVALWKYTEDGDDGCNVLLNYALRTNPLVLQHRDPTIDATIKFMDHQLQKAFATAPPLGSDIIVYRNIPKNILDKFYEIGTYMDCAYSSTSRFPQVAFNFGKPDDALLVLKIKKGNKVLPIEKISQQPHEGEILLNKNMPFNFQDVPPIYVESKKLIFLESI